MRRISYTYLCYTLHVEKALGSATAGSRILELNSQAVRYSLEENSGVDAGSRYSWITTESVLMILSLNIVIVVPLLLKQVN